MPMLGHSIFPFLFIVDKKQLNALSFYFAAVEDRLRFETVSEQVSWRKKKKKERKGWGTRRNVCFWWASSRQVGKPGKYSVTSLFEVFSSYFSFQSSGGSVALKCWPKPMDEVKWFFLVMYLITQRIDCTLKTFFSQRRQTLKLFWGFNSEN